MKETTIQVPATFINYDKVITKCDCGNDNLILTNISYGKNVFVGQCECGKNWKLTKVNNWSSKLTPNTLK